MKRRNLMTSVMGAALALSMPLAAHAETVNLKIANWLPPVHHMTGTLRAWADELEKASGGEITVEVMTTPLAKPTGQYDLAKNGIVDIAWSVAAFQPKRFWKLNAAEVPFSAPSAEAAAVAAWRWYDGNGFIEEDTSDTKLLAFFAHAPHMYHSRVPLTSLADFKDLKVRAGGNGVRIAEMMGAVPVGMPPGQTNEAMSKGTIDVSQFPWESVKGFRLHEVSTHHLEIPGGTYAGIFWMTMNPKTWDKLSDTQKAAVTKVSGEWGTRFISQKWDEQEAVGLEVAKSSGNTIGAMSEADTAKLFEMTRVFETDWIAKANEAGLDGDALMANFKEIAAASN
jgi:TRAP-type C4-dicarboxylate transport system substrate-binding protein